MHMLNSFYDNWKSIFNFNLNNPHTDKERERERVAVNETFAHLII